MLGLCVYVCLLWGMDYFIILFCHICYSSVSLYYQGYPTLAHLLYSA